jgi:hypothetical protein
VTNKYSRFAVRAALALLLGFALRIGLTHGAARGSNLQHGLPNNESLRRELKQQMAESTTRLAAEGGPKFLLPAEQRAGWIAAWNKLRDCTKAYEFDGVMPVQETYGDGMTPSPVIAGQGPAHDRALEACPFDTSLFDAAKVSAAISDQISNRRR